MATSNTMAEENEQLRKALQDKEARIQQLERALANKAQDDGKSCTSYAQRFFSEAMPTLAAVLESKPDPPPEPFRFLDLPAELRDVVYDICMTRGKVFIRPRPRRDGRYTGFEDFERPDWPLLLVSHQVRQEAAKVFMSRNHFVLSHDICSTTLLLSSPGETRLRSDPYLLKRLAQRHMRSVSVTLDIRSFIEDPLSFASSVGEELRRVWPGSLQNLTTDERALEFHHRCALLNDSWGYQCASFTNVDHLEVDITNCICPIGCHRMICAVASAITCAYRNVRAIPKLGVVEILGVQNTTELGIIERAVRDALRHQRPDDRKRLLRFKACKLGEVEDLSGDQDKNTSEDVEVDLSA